jgi:hypothetical protein
MATATYRWRRDQSAFLESACQQGPVTPKSLLDQLEEANLLYGAKHKEVKGWLKRHRRQLRKSKPGPKLFEGPLDIMKEFASVKPASKWKSGDDVHQTVVVPEKGQVLINDDVPDQKSAKSTVQGTKYFISALLTTKALQDQCIPAAESKVSEFDGVSVADGVRMKEVTTGGVQFIDILHRYASAPTSVLVCLPKHDTIVTNIITA